MMPGRVGCGGGLRWGRGGALQAGTCMWDQEVHHLDSVEVDHHTTAVGGSADSAVTAELGNTGPLPGWWWYVCVCARVGLGRKEGGFMGVTGVWILSFCHKISQEIIPPKNISTRTKVKLLG